MSEEEKTITIVLVQKGPDVRTEKILIMDKENTITHTPTNGGVIVVEKNGVYEKRDNIPTEFDVKKMLTAEFLHKVAGKVEEVDNAVTNQTSDQNTGPIFGELSNVSGDVTGDNIVGGYRVTKRRRNPRRKQKKSYRRRRI